MYKLLIISLLIICFSCQYNFEANDSIKIDLDKKTNTKPLQESIYDINIIQFESKLESLIGNYGKIIVDKERIYIHDTQQNYLHVFHVNGNYYGTIKRIGRAGDEYIEISDFILSDSTIIIYDGITGNYLEFSLELDYLRTENIGLGSKISLNKDGFIIFNNRPNKDEFYITTPNGNYLLNESDKYIPSVGSATNLFNYSDTTIVIKYFDNKVYYINNSSLRVKYEFDFNKYNIPNDFFNGTPAEIHTNFLRSDNVFFLENYIENDEWIIFRANGNGIFYNKENKDFYNSKNFNYPYSVILINNPVCINNDKYYTIVSLTNVINAILPASEDESLMQQYSFLKNFTDYDLSDAANDFLIEFKIKNLNH